MQFFVEITKDMEHGKSTLINIPGTTTNVEVVVPEYNPPCTKRTKFAGTLIPHLPAHTPPVLESGGRWS